MKNIYFLLFAMAPSAISAQTVNIDAPKPENCVLHIWPTANITSQTQGIGAMFGNLGYLDDRRAHFDRDAFDQDLLKSTIFGKNGEKQIDLMKSHDFSQIFDDKDLQIFVESSDEFKLNPPYWQSQKDSHSKIRSSLSKNSCYYELISVRTFFVKSPLMKPTLYSEFIIKHFDKSEKAIFRFNSIEKSHADKFQSPLATSIETNKQSVDEAERIFKLNFSIFLENYKIALMKHKNKISKR